MEVTQSERSRFRHEALLYAGKDDFVFRAGAYIREGVEAGEAVLVVVGVAKIAWLREHLGDQAEAVAFADMADVGRNPARIIPAWRDFVEANASGAGARGIGEPIHPERSP
ncbi:MAG TPA: MEDS domain-containing protein, partial [Gaiellaceae bacterium]|nr:MEDS domain-containing protein [Gaiellaceae bacterium]